MRTLVDMATYSFNRLIMGKVVIGNFYCAIYCCATEDILTKLLQQCFLFLIVVVIPGHNLGNSQVSVIRTIGPTLVDMYFEVF